MKARIEWAKSIGQVFMRGEVQERHYCQRIWEDSTKDFGCLVRIIWWDGQLKCVRHWFEFESEHGEKL